MKPTAVIEQLPGISAALLDVTQIHLPYQRPEQPVDNIQALIDEGVPVRGVAQAPRPTEHRAVDFLAQVGSLESCVKATSKGGWHLQETSFSEMRREATTMTLEGMANISAHAESIGTTRERRKVAKAVESAARLVIKFAAADVIDLRRTKEKNQADYVAAHIDSYSVLEPLASRGLRRLIDRAKAKKGQLTLAK